MQRSQIFRASNATLETRSDELDNDPEAATFSDEHFVIECELDNRYSMRDSRIAQALGNDFEER